MWKLNNLVIAGSEVFTLPTPLSPEALYEASRLDAGKPRRRRRNASLLLHTLAVGALPLPVPGRRR